MRRLFPVLAAPLLLGLAACGPEDPPEEETATPSTEVSQSVEVSDGGGDDPPQISLGGRPGRGPDHPNLTRDPRHPKRAYGVPVAVVCHHVPPATVDHHAPRFHGSGRAGRDR